MERTQTSGRPIKSFKKKKDTINLLGQKSYRFKTEKTDEKWKILLKE